MWRLSEFLTGQGNSVIMTTSTKLCYSFTVDRFPLSVGIDKKQLKQGECKVFGKEILKESDKIKGYEPEELDKIFESGVADYVIVEADGAKGRSLKAHADHEPVLSAKAHLIIVVVGMDCIGQPISEDSVHRSKLFCERVGKKMGEIITKDDVEAIIYHAKGYLKKATKQSEVVVFYVKKN
ncbi:putative selenium-dependent hydroxylase accessory protein YqeC [bacterium]|nr:putative selenium-dependent hydroxylase accessory protein YqeC [bacterium]MBU1918808.1 putative selenium-dependent hydroxylase accessory protein YqeC [bacterium]